MRALVSGGTGFIGGHVVDLLLEEGHSVKIFSRKTVLTERLSGKGIGYVRGDFENPLSLTTAMEGVDVFFHIGEIRSTSMAACLKNIALLQWIVSSPAVKKIGRLVFVSSITVAGIPSDVPATEDTVPAIILNDQYTFYKRTCEELLARNHTSTEYAIVRPAVAYGPRSTHLRKIASALARAGAIGLPFVGSGRNLAPFIHVKDLARAIYFAGVRPGAAGQTINITDGLSHTWLEFFDAIGGAAGRRFIIIIPFPPLCLKVPVAFIDCFASLCDLRLDFRKYIAYFSRKLLFSRQKAKDILGMGTSLHGFK
jgi:nucleoside-diphosphate-sugar epimerase